MTFLSFLSARAAHRAAAVCCAEYPCCMVRVCRSGVSLQTCREEHAVTTSRETCQSPRSLLHACCLSCSPYSRMRCSFFARILLPICLEHDEHLVGNRHVAVFTPLALEDKQLLAVKADVVPSEAACLADPEGAVVDDGKQGFVVQGAVAEKAGNLLLGEHSEKQHCLSNLQAIVIDTAVCILCQTQLFSKKRNAVPEFGYSRNCLVQCIIGHGERGWRGLMTGGFAVSRHLPPPFIET